MGRVMAKKPSASSAHGKRAARNVRHIPNSQIDFSDIPELSDEQLAAMRRISKSPEGTNKSRPQIVSKKLQQLRRRSATLTGKEIVAAVQNGRRRAGR